MVKSGPLTVEGILYSSQEADNYVITTCMSLLGDDNHLMLTFPPTPAVSLLSVWFRDWGEIGFTFGHCL